jgi:transcriptional regulator with XRE-family HTH domain
MKLVEDPKIAKYKSNLKKMRIRKGFTQDNLSELSGVNIKSIASYEQNDNKFNTASVSTVFKLANALGCEIEDLLNKDTIKD